MMELDPLEPEDEGLLEILISVLFSNPHFINHFVKQSEDLGNAQKFSQRSTNLQEIFNIFRKLRALFGNVRKVNWNSCDLLPVLCL